LVELGWRNLCKMQYRRIDKFDIWIGYELGGETLYKHTFKIRGAFENGVRM